LVVDDAAAKCSVLTDADVTKVKVLAITSVHLLVDLDFAVVVVVFVCQTVPVIVVVAIVVVTSVHRRYTVAGVR